MAAAESFLGAVRLFNAAQVAVVAVPDLGLPPGAQVFGQPAVVSDVFFKRRSQVGKRAPLDDAREAGMAREGVLGVAANGVARIRHRLVARAAVQVRVVRHRARVSFAVRVERLAPHVAAVQGVHALERETQPRLAAGSAGLWIGSLMVRNRDRRCFVVNASSRSSVEGRETERAPRRGDDSRAFRRGRARAGGGRTLYASSAVSCFARAAGNVMRIASYLRVGGGGKTGQEGAGGRAVGGAGDGEEKKRRFGFHPNRDARPRTSRAESRKRVVFSEEATRDRQARTAGRASRGWGSRGNRTRRRLWTRWRWQRHVRRQ